MFCGKRREIQSSVGARPEGCGRSDHCLSCSCVSVPTRAARGHPAKGASALTGGLGLVEAVLLLPWVREENGQRLPQCRPTVCYCRETRSVSEITSGSKIYLMVTLTRTKVKLFMGQRACVCTGVSVYGHACARV